MDRNGRSRLRNIIGSDEDYKRLRETNRYSLFLTLLFLGIPWIVGVITLVIALLRRIMSLSH